MRRTILVAALVAGAGTPALASAPGGPAMAAPRVSVAGPLVGAPGRPLALAATIGGKPAAGVRWSVHASDAARARLAGARLTARGPGGVGVEAATPRGTARALLAFVDPRHVRLPAGVAPVGLDGRAPRASFGAPVGDWLLTDAGSFQRCWRAVYGPGPSAPKVDFARRSVVALVGYYDGEDAVVTHVSPGRPATVHVVLPQRLDANREPGPAAPGAPMTAFWSVPRVGGPARLMFRVYGLEEAHPLRAWK